MSITRLAPSPTGALHLGNARTFLINWLLARQNDWKIILRIEDLDGPRIKTTADPEAMEDLRWLGIDWDQGPIHQSDRQDLYAAAIARLIESRQAYPCICSRKEIETAASAPHAEDGATIYPGTCRGKFASIAEAKEKSGREPAIRFAVNENEIVEWDDAFAGHQTFDVAKQLGDFVIAKNDGTAAYQLSVVVDDAAMNVTHIVRGDDLIDSTPRQILLYRALGPPTDETRKEFEFSVPRSAFRLPRLYYHLPLVVGEDGRRLAKRHGDTRLSFYRKLGVSAGRILAMLARWSGVENIGEEISIAELVEKFRIDRVLKEKIVFTSADDAWLRET